MRDVELGRRFRAVRHRLRLRQRDVAVRAGVSQSLVSFIERGRFDRVSINAIRTVAAALGAELVLFLRWRGGEIDRMLDEGHAALAGAVIAALQRDGWQVRTEVSYSAYGERGSIDILAWHALTRTLLVVEVKTELNSVEETLRKHDEKARLAPRVAREQFGWPATMASRLLALPDLSTPRRRVERQAPVLAVAYPTRGWAVRSWLKGPVGRVSGLVFVTSGPASAAVSRKRVRCGREAESRSKVA
jgi:transcriptional regulator with XRE-family HTH domain